jgi:hypothetical protein
MIQSGAVVYIVSVLYILPHRSQINPIRKPEKQPIKIQETGKSTQKKFNLT